MKKQTILACAALSLCLLAAAGLVATLPLAAEMDFSGLRDIIRSAPLAQAEEGAFVETALASAQENPEADPSFPPVEEVAEDNSAAPAGTYRPIYEDAPEHLIQLYTGILRDMLLSDLSVEIPETAVCDGVYYDGRYGETSGITGTSDIFLNLVWESARGNPVQLYTWFVGLDPDPTLGTLKYYTIHGLDETTATAPIIDAARDAFSAQLGIDLPEDASLETHIFYMPPTETGYAFDAYLTWSDPSVEMARDPLSSIVVPVYTAHYGNADLSEGTGNLVSLEKTFVGSPQLDVDEAPDYSQAQKDAAVETARAFAEKLGLQTADMQMVHPIASNVYAGLTVIFATPDGMSLLISVTNEGDVIGYSLRQDIVEMARQYRIVEP